MSSSQWARLQTFYLTSGPLLPLSNHLEPPLKKSKHDEAELREVSQAIAAQLVDWRMELEIVEDFDLQNTRIPHSYNIPDTTTMGMTPPEHMTPEDMIEPPTIGK